MDSSQSSDFFAADNTDLSCYTEMDSVSYGTLIANVKAVLYNGVEKEMEKPTFPYHFTTLLDDCCECVSQSLDIIINILCEPSIEISKLTEYMTDAISILQMLSDYIKTVMENMSMSCCKMKSFPTTTGRIIMMVYTHCKDSECLYGATLSRVEMQLKEMFRTCHELQITYLMLIEKHFIFDLAVKEELDVLIEALDINLKIGEIVQILDVKTMAEQWKAYTAICEKYASCLTDSNIYYKCTKVLCIMAENNIRTATEKDQEEKIVLRSLKVCSFTVKILLKICSLFKNATMESFEHILELLINVYVISCLYPNTTTYGRTPQFMNQFNINVTNPTDCLLRELLLDKKFVNCLMSIETFVQDEKLLGYIHIILALIKSIIQRKVDHTVGISKNKLIDCIFSLLPHCDIWFNDISKFDGEAKSDSSQRLYEELLSHATALSATMNSEEYYALEKTMIEAILSTECYSALFSSNLWVLLARMSGRQLLFVQLTSLCKIYQKMENNRLFHNSPQEVHLSHTINRLFQVMPIEDRVKISREFSWSDNKNVSLWTCLNIANLPQDVRSKAEAEIAERLKIQFYNIASNATVEVDTLVKTMTLAGSCSFRNDNEATDCLIKAWEKTCPKNNKLFIHGDMDKGTLWYFQYVEALVALTNSLEKKLRQQTAILVKVLHGISEIITTNNVELQLVLTPLLCRLALCDIRENDTVVEALVVKTFKHLFRESSNAIALKLYDTLRKYRRNKNLDKMISKINADVSLNENWAYFMKHGVLKQDGEWNKQLLMAKDFKYKHKCIKSIVKTVKNSNGSNFDLADIDTLFENESDSEQPVSKKVKLNDEADVIIARLENDASLLCKIKENIFSNEHVNKIRNVCKLLQNIID